MKKKILSVFGTRPEAIKMAPVVKELQKYPDLFESIVCVTAQHRHMLDQVLQLFKIQPDYDLNIMAARQDLYDITSNVLLGMRRVLDEVQPDIVLVHGDTTTTMSASLSAFYSGIPVCHVEAGLRTGNKQSPFPEEINRRVAGCLCDLHFAPTPKAQGNLLAEGINAKAIHVTGNTVIDALFMAREEIFKGNLEQEILHQITYEYPLLRRLFSKIGLLNKTNNGNKNSEDTKIILVTGHRRENFGEGFENICLALKEIAQRNHYVEIIYPVHLNPNVQEPVNKILANSPSIHLIPPQDYFPFVYLMNRSYLIITDSGGIQEEAPSLGKPVLVTRDTTERPEAVTAGTVRLVGTDKIKIIGETEKLLKNQEEYVNMAKSHNPYGDGHASERIVSILKSI